MEDKGVLRIIKLTYKGEELEMYLEAWKVYPTLTKDCFQKQMEKAYLRAKFVKELKASKVNSSQ